ncbi:MAG: hypothetical protein E2577_11400, partial [Starkeya sp.]|nr:hypothetical protein [Starkeya sp.]
MAGRTHKTASGDLQLPANNGVFYDGGWHTPLSDRWTDVVAPGTGERLMRVADAGIKAADEPSMLTAQSRRA